MVNIGILGAGRVVANRYAEVFEKEVSGVKVVAVADLVKERADAIAKQLQSDALYDLDALLARPDVDTVLVATESGRHYAHAKAALSAGKHVIVEKPPTLLPAQVSELEAFAAEQGRMYAVIFQNRLNPAMRKLKETVDAGRFGKLVLATIRLRWCRYQKYYDDGWHGTWALDGGVISQQAIHHIDALQWVCGPVASVCAAQDRALNRLEADDTTVAAVRFKSGTLGVIEATTAARPEDFEASISVVGEKGMAVIGGIALNRVDTWRFVEPEPDDATVPETYSQEVPTGYGLSHGPLVQEITDRLNAGRLDPPITGQDALPALNLLHALYKSAEDRAWVDLDAKPLSAKLGK